MQGFVVTSEQIAWFAGLLEGEGCLSFVKGSGWRIAVRMTDEDIILRIQAIFGGSVYFEARSKLNPKHKDTWQWQLSNRAAIYKVVTAVYPHMGERRKTKMDAFLAYHADPPKKSDVMRRNWENPEYRAKMIAERKARWQNEEWRANNIWTIKKAAESRWPTGQVS